MLVNPILGLPNLGCTNAVSMVRGVKPLGERRTFPKDGTYHGDSCTQPTKQQLDDLDALLQRMLSLPVSLPEEEFPPAETIPLPPSPSPLESRPQPPLPLISSVPADVLTPPPGNLVLTDPLSPSIPAEPEENPLRSVPDQRNTTEGVPHGPPQPVFAKPAPVLPPPTPEPWLPPVVPEERQVARPTFIARHPSSASSRPLEDPLWLLPVLWCNRLFDWLALGLGAAGTLAAWPHRPKSARLHRPGFAPGGPDPGNSRPL